MSLYPCVEFAETEFQPRRSWQTYPGAQTLSRGDIEKGSIPVLKSATQKRQLIKSRLSLNNLTSKKLKSSLVGKEGESEKVVNQSEKEERMDNINTNNSVKSVDVGEKGVDTNAQPKEIV